MIRPPHPERAPAGYEWQAIIDDSLDWTTNPANIGATAGRCRHIVPDRTRLSNRRGCGRAAAAVLYRGWSRRPYPYCKAHLYGRWIEDGRVMHWILRPVGP